MNITDDVLYGGCRVMKMIMMKIKDGSNKAN